MSSDVQIVREALENRPAYRAKRDEDPALAALDRLVVQREQLLDELERALTAGEEAVRLGFEAADLVVTTRALRR